MEREPMRPVSERQQQILEEAVSRYEWDLVGSEAERYLRGRGLADETVAGARLGVVKDPAAGHSKYEGMLCIPYLDQTGKPLTIRFRCLRDHDCRQHGHGKYLTLPGDQPRLYNVRALTGVKPGAAASVSEGELDALVLGQCGYPAIALAGANAWKYHYGQVMEGFNRLLIWADGDDAGAEMAARIRKALPATAEIVAVPKGEDVNSVFLKYGKDGIDGLARGDGPERRG